MCCNFDLPRYGHYRDACDNELTRMFWGRFPIERGLAVVWHNPGSETARLVYRLKYMSHPETGRWMGEVMVSEFEQKGFFADIDVILPMPLARNRQRKRGYNQCEKIAEGISRQTGIPVANSKTVGRDRFEDTQTHKGLWERNDNVEGIFHLANPAALAGKHILIVDDVVTTGATITSLANEIAKAGNTRISVLTWAIALH